MSQVTSRCSGPAFVTAFPLRFRRFQVCKPGVERSQTPLREGTLWCDRFDPLENCPYQPAEVAHDVGFITRLE
ncbi:hypothetical protein [Natrinema halophilum]|uniref:Uncharacterized protein n=1 Tax=Natrinema halophilum TaxID=1699371 RepID=A0A7D5KD19_9EURY|nr:hypothetical protein [Natrinema halophilum]QLG49036.1 hypothetical protein HYG82_09340 [Natrinema halophilum]